jgi:hypothetical protein
MEEREKLREQRRKEKELMKALETPEEKRARRLAKKIAKGRKQKEQMGWDEEYMGYTNADNPFGDEHLLDTFVWQKKLEKEGKSDLSQADLEKIQKMKMMESKLELEKVKRRRLEREREKEQREYDQEMMQREKEAEYFREWEKQEDTFHLQQAKLRSDIRIKDGRAKPIDLLARYISAEDDDLAIEMHEPYTYLNGLTIQDLEDLLEDIKVYIELEQGKNVGYWRDITIITEEELNKLRKMDPTYQNRVQIADFVGDRRSGINPAVIDDVATVFKGKSLQQLELLEKSIHSKLRGGEGVDVGYWESLLQQLKAHMARTRLRERHQEELRRKLFRLKQEQGIESAPLFPIINEGSNDDHSQALPSSSSDEDEEDEESHHVGVKSKIVGGLQQLQPSTSMASGEDEPKPGTSAEVAALSPAAANVAEEEEQLITEEDLVDPATAEYETGGYSPRLIRPVDLPPDTIIFDAEDDLKRLEFARHQVLVTGQLQKDEDEELIRRAQEGMNAEECQFSVEFPVKQEALIWSDKYRPRKPRFFNRVHTGFEWNKYNQTHYDIDNPPPKIVQGYKFNIFYPDLIDKTKTPQYTLTPCDDSKDFAILRFRAGPPYEDIAFKIVNREWEYSYKRGFRCQFHNNIFQLWFHFKRYRYRR